MTPTSSPLFLFGVLPLIPSHIQCPHFYMYFVEQVLLVRVTPSPLGLSSVVQNGISAGACTWACQFHQITCLRSDTQHMVGCANGSFPYQSSVLFKWGLVLRHCAHKVMSCIKRIEDISLLHSTYIIKIYFCWNLTDSIFKMPVLSSRTL